QVGVNYANDYSDGIRGTDAERVGPIRLVGQGLASPSDVKRAAFIAFGVAVVAGLILVLLTQAWWLIIVGALAVGSAWFYTGGPRPYGYAGLGEIFVFVFFGLVAVVGTTFVLTDQIQLLAILFAIPVGALAVALLVINNLRDIPGDTLVGKNTLAVRMGDANTRDFYGFCLFLPFAITALVGLAGIGFVDQFPAGSLIAVAALPAAFIPWQIVKRGASGAELIPVLAWTGRVQLLYGGLVTIGIAIAG
ncbi:MAG: 1,4-dihydroxy-2-naphthoate polyprenyltransferase, partial [Actinobacteria bacterium]|nr:1,4-dihydroxy-2-naphthoate polyprenyltransferase [Actinomycetota bacterium]